MLPTMLPTIMLVVVLLFLTKQELLYSLGKTTLWPGMIAIIVSQIAQITDIVEIEMINSSLVYVVYKVAVLGVVLLIFLGITRKILKKDTRFFVELLISTLCSVFVSVIFTGPIESVVELLPTYILTPLFQQYASPVDANSIKISTPHYEMGMLLQDGYICKKYDFSSRSEEHTSELQSPS